MRGGFAPPRASCRGPCPPKPTFGRRVRGCVSPGSPCLKIGKNMSILDTEIMNFEGNSWTTRDASTGLICFGMTGSGKSSGPLRSIAIRYLELGYGGIVFCAKPDECETWEAYARNTGRTNDIIKLSNETFGFLDYEFSRPAEEGGGQVENVVAIFLEVVKISKDKKAGSTNDEYWENAIKQFLRNTISLLIMARETVTLPNIKVAIDTSLRSNDMAEKLKHYFDKFEESCGIKCDEAKRKTSSNAEFENALKKFEKEYCRSDSESANEQLVGTARQYCNKLIMKAIYFDNHHSSDYELACNYFLVEFPQLDERTRSNTISSFTVLADSMLRGEFLRCFGSDSSSLSLEDIYRKGKILIVDQDVKRHGLVGQMTAAIIKLCFEKMIERREDITDPNARPVFLWGDECQFFALDYDQKFQTTARSSRTLTVYATQNLDNLYDGYGKEKANSLIGNLGTKIFCQNGDHTTNKWAADSIGQEVLRRHSQNIGDSKSGSMKGDYNKSDNFTEGWSEQKDYKVDIVEFTTLQTGGPRGQCKVGYIFWQSGRVLKNGDVYVRGVINQKCRRICGARLERHCPPIPKIGSKDTRQGLGIYWYDYINLAFFTASLSVSGYGIHLIYSENDHLLLEVPEVGIVTVATILLWFFAFTLDTFWGILKTLMELLWFKLRKKRRPKYKVINRVPLVVFTWLYLLLIRFLGILIQRHIYEGKTVWHLLGFEILASLAHRFLKSAGGRSIPVD